MDGKNALDFFTKFTRPSLGLLGVWPENKNDRLSAFMFIATFLLVFFVVILTQTIKIIQVWGDLDQMSFLLATADIPFIVAIIKLIVLWYNKNKVKNLYSLMIKDWENEKTHQEKDIMLKNGQIGKTVSFICIFLGHASINAHIIQVFLENLEIYRTDDLNATRTLYIEGYFPFDYNYSPIFEIVCFIEYLATFLATVSYTGTDGFFGQIVFHLCGQYSILRLSLLDIVSEIDNKVSLLDFDHKLNRIVQGHEYINSCITTMENIFNLMFLVQLLACSIQFCIQGFQLILCWIEPDKSVIVGTLFFITFLVYMMGNFYIYCYAAESLQVESFKFAQAAYECQWFHLPPKKIKSLIFIMQRARKPVNITAGKFFVLGLQLFGNILRTSLGYLSVLVTMQKSNY